MQTIPIHPRQVVERALVEAPEKVLQAMADVYLATTQPTTDRTVIIRVRGEGELTSETLTSAPETAPSPRPISLLEVFQVTGQPYLDALERGREARKELLAAEGGVMSSSAVAEHLGISRQAVDKRRRSGRLLAVTAGKRGYVYPAWQFTEDGVLPGFEEVLADLSDHDPMMHVIFFLGEADNMISVTNND